PLYKFRHIDFSMPDVVYGFNDSCHVQFMQTILPTSSKQYVHFPHFPVFQPIAPERAADTEGKERRIFFAGSAHVMFRKLSLQPERILTNSRFRSLYDRLGVVDRLTDELGNNDFRLDEFIRSSLQTIAETNLFKNAESFIECDVFMRAMRRRLIVKWISCLPLALIGEGWHDAMATRSRDIRIFKPLDYFSTEHIVRSHYSVGLNIFQGQICGPHDRIYNAAAAGQVLVSDANRFLREFPVESYVSLSPFREDVAVAACSRALFDIPAERYVRELSSYLLRRSDLSVQSAARRVLESVKRDG
ncbi:MAG: hypothetical protein L0Z50_33945, partial [Verrucomicrobiales bacterium]|nr:hypothetical protein [Verrucomicrobiales bacterium]